VQAKCLDPDRPDGLPPLGNRARSKRRPTRERLPLRATLAEAADLCEHPACQAARAATLHDCYFRESGTV
jgi:hypothetical protein